MKKNVSLIVKGKRPPVFTALVEKDFKDVVGGERVAERERSS